MENKTMKKPFLPIAVLFVLSMLLIVGGKSVLTGWNVDYRVLLVGNSLLFAATWLGFTLQTKALRNNNPQVFVRMMYSNLLVKFFVVVLAVNRIPTFGGGAAAARLRNS